MSDPDDQPPLKPREVDILRGVAKGLTNAHIGRGLCVSEDSIKQYLRAVYRKLGARDRASAVAIAYDRGILGGES